jgi:hypothetical protein
VLLAQLAQPDLLGEQLEQLVQQDQLVQLDLLVVRAVQLDLLVHQVPLDQLVQLDRLEPQAPLGPRGLPVRLDQQVQLVQVVLEL